MVLYASCCLIQCNRTAVFKVTFFIHCCWSMIRFPKSVLHIKIYNKWKKHSQLKRFVGSEAIPHSKTRFLFCVWRHISAQNNWLSHINYFVVLVYLAYVALKMISSFCQQRTAIWNFYFPTTDFGRVTMWRYIELEGITFKLFMFAVHKDTRMINTVLSL
jgi:hypothetical protein